VQGVSEGLAATVLCLRNERVFCNFLRLELVLQLCDATRRVIWVGDIVFVDTCAAASRAQYKVDDLGDGLCLVLVEPRDPTRRNVL
jgi:hypothetical protein